MSNMISGLAGYQRANQAYKAGKAAKTEKTYSELKNSKVNQNVKTSVFKPVESGSSLIPKAHEKYGVTVGNVELSDAASEYYDKLKDKFGDMDFILVSKDMKAQVAQNASLYGNASKPVVLIDEEKLEKMATDESFRKKYEGIIEMSKAQLAQAKNSFASSGANVKNFGITVDENGNTSFFATVEKKTAKKTGNTMKERLEKSAEKKKADKAKAKKAADKKAQEARLEKLKEKNKEEKDVEIEDEAEAVDYEDYDIEYIEFRADNMEDLIRQVSDWAISNTSSVITEQESYVGQNIDFTIG